MPPAEVKDAQVSLRLPASLKEQMESYAELTGRSKSYVAMEALSEYLAWRIPQVQDLKAAIAAADRGEFASDEEVEAVYAKHAAASSGTKRAESVKKR